MGDQEDNQELGESTALEGDEAAEQGQEDAMNASGPVNEGPYNDGPTAKTPDYGMGEEGVGPCGGTTDSYGQSHTGTPLDGLMPGGTGNDSDDDMPQPNRLERLGSNRSNASYSSAASSIGAAGSGLPPRGGSARSRSRPSSGTSAAVIQLRGSRPNSAAVAQEIEGFEDDFMERVDEEPEEEEADMYGEEDMDEDDGPSLDELIERAKQEQSRLLEANEVLQRRVRLALDFRNKGRPPVARDMSRLDGASTRYRAALRQWIEVLEERDSVEAHYQATIFDMKSTLEERIKRADDISRAYKHFRLEVAKSSEHSKTGRPVSDKLLAQLEQEDQSKEEEVQRVRLKNIHLTNQLKRIEATLRQKEELAEGLHLIDFEQLKIENQSLNEKIEERNEELLKLRKKTTTTVQILTHVREKLQYVAKENETLVAQLEELDKELAGKRDKLGRAKATRDTMRQAGRRIREASTQITNPSLLTDIEAHKERRDALLNEIDDAHIEYNELLGAVQRATRKLHTLVAASGGDPRDGLRSVLGSHTPGMASFKA